MTNDKQPSGVALEGSSIVADGSTEGITFVCYFDSFTAQQWHCSSHFYEEERSQHQPQMTINNQQVSAALLVLSEVNTIMTDGSREGIAFSCILDSVVAH